jgi:hypothetical protein
MGAERSTAKVARALGKSKTLMDRWSGQDGWPARASAWDAELDVRRREEFAAATVAVSREQTETAARIRSASTRSPGRSSTSWPATASAARARSPTLRRRRSSPSWAPRHGRCSTCSRSSGWRGAYPPSTWVSTPPSADPPRDRAEVRGRVAGLPARPPGSPPRAPRVVNPGNDRPPASSEDGHRLGLCRPRWACGRSAIRVGPTASRGKLSRRAVVVCRPGRDSRRLRAARVRGAELAHC